MLLKARYVLPVTSPHIEYGAVLVQDDKIKAVGHAADLEARYPDEEVIDFGLAALMPGFVNCHTHLEYTVMRGILNDVPYTSWKAYLLEKEELMTSQDWDDSARLGGFEALAAGVTTIADITQTGASMRAAHELGIRGVIYREVSSHSAAEVAPSLEEALVDLDAWRAYHEASEACTTGEAGATGKAGKVTPQAQAAAPSRLRFGIAPDPLYACHPLLLTQIAACAREHKLPLAAHIAGSREEFEFIKYGSSALSLENASVKTESLAAIRTGEILPTGVSPVVYAHNWRLFEAPEILCIHAVHVDDRDLDILARSGVSIAVCPRAEAKLSMGVPSIVKMRHKDIPVVLGTDSPAASDANDMIEEMRFALLVQRALHDKDDFLVAADLIKMATIEGAQALGLADKIGSLDPHKQADIIAIDLSASHQVPSHYPNSAVVHTADADDVLMTMVDGKILYRNKAFTYQDQDQVTDLLAKAEKIRVQLRQ